MADALSLGLIGLGVLLFPFLLLSLMRVVEVWVEFNLSVLVWVWGGWRKR